MGYAAGESRGGLNSSTAAEQRRFLERLLDDAGTLRAALVIWFAARDPAFAAAPYDLLASSGLRTAEDVPREAWPVWLEAARRPFEPALTTVPGASAPGASVPGVSVPVSAPAAAATP